MEFYESVSEWKISFKSAFVSSICIDFRVTFVIFDEIDNVNVVIESSFTLSKNSDRSRAINPENTQELSAILELFNCRVWRITVTENGMLDISFDNETNILVSPDEVYEAWEVNWPNGKLLCGPGGSISYFSG